MLIFKFIVCRVVIVNFHRSHDNSSSQVSGAVIINDIISCNNTITDKQKLIEELNKIEQEGFALDREENEKDVRCIAAPLRNYQGKVVAAVSISGPAYRLNEGNQNHLKDELISTCQEISARLGFQFQT